MTKTCFKCGSVLPATEDYFYRHRAMADGLLGKCKECTKKDAREYAKANPEKVRLLTREKRRRPKYLAMDKAWREAHPDMVKAHKLKWELANPDKRKAQWAVNNAVRDGRIVKLERCEGCGLDRPTEGHHEDYSKPLQVIWLCTACHGETRQL